MATTSEFLVRLDYWQRVHRPAKFAPENCVPWWPDISHYAQSYAENLARKAGSIKRVLEIGVQGGGSARLWASLFVDAEVHGIDTDPGCAAHSGGRVTIHIGDQGDWGFLERVIAPHAPFDLVIDDGGHVGTAQSASLEFLWPLVSPGGTYVIEDLLTAHTWENNGQCLEFLKAAVDSVNRDYNGSSLLPGLASIRFEKNLCWMHKHAAPRPD